MDTDDDIPVLTDTIAGRKIGVAPSPQAEPGERQAVDLDRLQAKICASSLTLAEAMLRDACQEAEHMLLQRVMTQLRAELPAIVRGVLKEQLED